jgi:transcriptional regulator with XRE-family HTH domain
MEAAGRSDFGTLLRQLRLDAAMTQQDLAERAKLSVEAISQLERGARTRPQRETVTLLARALDLSPERQAQLTDAAQITHRGRPRECSDRSNLSVLRLVRDIQTTANHNLPQPLTSFIGRRQEIGEISASLAEHQLVTVVGAGGVGKTRVVVQLAAELVDNYPDGIWLVDLAPLSREALIENAVLTSLKLSSPTGDALELITAYLKARRILLILDNCEHAVAQARLVAEKIREACAVRILVTSRQPLQLAGEQIDRLPLLTAHSILA